MELVAEKLSCEREQRLLFENLDLSVRAGEILRIEGANGSGKTTLLRILCGLFNHYEGTLFWNQQPMHEVFEDYVAQLVYVGHASGIKSCLTAEENLQWLSALRNDHPVAMESIWAALSQVGLRGYEDVFCSSMSAGQKKRVNLARLYLTAGSGNLWILDEPFSSIDREGVAHLERLMESHVKAGGKVILTSHQPLQVEYRVHSIDLDGKK